MALVLGGGNALGSYQAGVYAALRDGGVTPDWIVGTSIGAINGALIAGNAADAQVAALMAFWRPAEGAPALPSSAETWRRSMAVQQVALTGRAGLFDPVGPLGSWWRPDPPAAGPGLFDQAPLAQTLAQAVDWDRLNHGPIRYSALAVDIEDGGDRLFDTAVARVGVAEVRASGALPPMFPPVEIDGRLYADGGLSMNLPLDPVLGEGDAPPTLCIALDLLPLGGRRPATLGESMSRAQDLALAIQSRRTIARWQGMTPAAGVTLVRLAYADQGREVAGKAFDFSPGSVAQRWRSGMADGAALVAGIAAGEVGVTPGAFTLL